jgi:hypothetical protein
MRSRFFAAVAVLLVASGLLSGCIVESGSDGYRHHHHHYDDDR